ncbi:MAG TPA: SpoIIE family protein phosphatase [Planctomycetota bacterium]|nr:SpoIIE family protein phosphatase [Planctomycetota bacterium]
MERVLFAGAETQVVRIERGRAVILRFTGACSPELARWLPTAFKDVRHAVAVNLRGLNGIDAPFIQKILDLAGRKHPLAFINPPPVVLDLLESFSARVSLLSAEAAVAESGSLPDSVANETMALRELESRFRINPLWRRVDQEGAWLCALCGMEVDDVRIKDVATPGTGAVRNIRRHLLEDCLAWRNGRQAPLPASVLDAFLAEVNQRKRSEEAERKRRLAEELQTLQSRVETMQELERSVDQAKRRQLHLIPIDPPPDEVADIAVHYRPLQAVSGDFLDFYALEDNRFGVAVGDVSGHGIETAIVMGMAKMALRVRSQALGSVRDVVSYANRDLFSELRRTAFVTGVFLAVDRTTRRMAYVRAGHTKPIVRRANGTVEELGAGGLPLGVDGGKRFDAALEEGEIALAAGDLVFVYTDGLLEATAGGEQFGVERILDGLRAAPPDLPVQGVLAAVVASLDRFLAGTPLGDDLTAVALRIK